MGKAKKSKTTDPKPVETVSKSQDSLRDSSLDNEISPVKPQFNPADFEDWYLKQVTKEFADDIDKIRNASDFSDSSVPILVMALKQGASLFSEEERRIVMRS